MILMWKAVCSEASNNLAGAKIIAAFKAEPRSFDGFFQNVGEKDDV